jgi:hypothetical protein
MIAVEQHLEAYSGKPSVVRKAVVNENSRDPNDV